MLHQAVAEGLLDFSRADLRSERWQRYVTMVLSGLELRNRREKKTLLFHHTLMLLQSSRQAEQTSELSQHLNNLFADIQETYYPAAKKERKQLEVAAARTDIHKWRNRYGDTRDPEVQKRMAEFVASMERLRQETATKQKSKVAKQLGYIGQQLGIDPSRTSRKGNR